MIHSISSREALIALIIFLTLFVRRVLLSCLIFSFISSFFHLASSATFLSTLTFSLIYFAGDKANRHWMLFVIVLGEGTETG